METNAFAGLGGWGRPNDNVMIQGLYDLLETSDIRFGGWGPKRPKHLLWNICSVPCQKLLKVMLTFVFDRSIPNGMFSIF